MPGQPGVVDIDFGGVVVTRKRRLARGVGALRAVGGRRMTHGSTSLSPWFFGTGAASHRAPSVSALPCSPAGHGAPSSSLSTSVKLPDLFLAFCFFALTWSQVAFIKHDPVNPQATVATFKAIYGAPFRRNEGTLKKYLDGLRRCGLPAVVRKIAREQETIVPSICCNCLRPVLAPYRTSRHVRSCAAVGEQADVDAPLRRPDSIALMPCLSSLKAASPCGRRVHP